MDVKTIRAAVQQAKAFIKAAEPVLATTRKNEHGEWIETGKNSGALRRQSMDLTRALADMRRA